MKRFIALLGVLIFLLPGCSAPTSSADIAATTLPVYQFATMLCEGTGLTVSRLVTESVSCLHDYTLNVSQVKAVENADLVIISGAGLEEFMEDLLIGKSAIDASEGIALLCPDEEADHDHDSHGHEGHHHERDPHIWLSPVCAKQMADNICSGLSLLYPEYAAIFAKNLSALHNDLDSLQEYGASSLSRLSCREMITFHDGFSYFANAFQLTILEAVEEESGSEASAKELIRLIEEVEHHNLPAVFTEKSGSTSASGIISRETGCSVYSLDMAMSGNSYFQAMYHNIDTVKEALQ